MPSNTRRSKVCWNSVCSPVKARNCLGNCLRESGQRREPLPPDKITGIMLLLLKIDWLELLRSVVSLLFLFRIWIGTSVLGGSGLARESGVSGNINVD